MYNVHRYTITRFGWRDRSDDKIYFFINGTVRITRKRDYYVITIGDRAEG